MHNLRVETFIKIIFLVSLVALISAYFIEYVLGHQPCNLCLIERIPYGLTVVLIILNHILIKNERFMILLLILVFSFSLIISFYHFGIEQGIFEESSVCGLKDASNIVSKEELLKQLQVKNVSCKDVTFRIFGFSLTSLNIIISLILVIFLSKVFKNYEKFKK
ncbi:disulfide bond formation protein B [Candidatus Pelagibacter sp.]|nr:disulfide bond formation protein B [Candidatus Pelagibacter sp.]